MDDLIVRDRNKTQNFTVMINEIFKRNDVSARAKGIYAYIMTLPNDWKLYKSELYQHFSEGRDAINKAFKELEELGYIIKSKSKDKQGRFYGWEYHIFESANHTDLLKNRKSEKPKSENSHLLNTNLILNTNKQNGVQQKEKEFDRFWSMYPKKKSKGQAEKAWKKINLELYDIIFTALGRYKQSKDWTKADGKYIPYPATWLNAKGWEDDIDMTADKATGIRELV